MSRKFLSRFIRRCSLSLEVDLHLFGFGRARAERALLSEARFIVVAPDEVFVAFGLYPGQGTAMNIGRLLGIPQGLKALLAIDHLAALIIVKLLKIHGFNTSISLTSQLLKLYLIVTNQRFQQFHRRCSQTVETGNFCLHSVAVHPPCYPPPSNHRSSACLSVSFSAHATSRSN
ncbi:hypothetical protein ACVW0I_000247 [Bradyrhizobium sp. LM6.11]